MSTGNYPNPELTWGKSHDYNIAADLGFWDNRFGLTFEHYWRYETDKITAAPSYLYPPSTGVDGNVPKHELQQTESLGLGLDIDPPQHHRQSEVQRGSDTGQRVQDKYLDFGDESSVTPNLRRVGRSSMVWSMYEAEGLFQSQEEIDNWPLDQDGQGNATLAPGDIKYKDQDGNHVLDTKDLVLREKFFQPDFNFSLRLRCKLQRIFVNVMFQGATGYQQNIKELYTTNSGSLQRFQKYHLTDTWTPDNPGASLPRIKFATANDKQP